MNRWRITLSIISVIALVSVGVAIFILNHDGLNGAEKITGFMFTFFIGLGLSLLVDMLLMDAPPPPLPKKQPLPKALPHRRAVLRETLRREREKRNE